VGSFRRMKLKLPHFTKVRNGAAGLLPRSLP
jgi:hypothetical protein